MAGRENRSHMTPLNSGWLHAQNVFNRNKTKIISDFVETGEYPTIGNKSYDLTMRQLVNKNAGSQLDRIKAQQDALSAQQALQARRIEQERANQQARETAVAEQTALANQQRIEAMMLAQSRGAIKKKPVA